MRKICYITYHNWDTKRHGGFHQFARATAECGIETVFFSFARPYYIRWKHEERLNKNILKKLSDGITYDIGSGKILNITFPTFAIPGPLRKYFPYMINEWLMNASFSSFTNFRRRWLDNTDCFVFESCEAVLLAPRIKTYYPKAKIVYRPSDPLWEFSNDFFAEKGEARMLELADKIITVNEESIEGYRNHFPNLFDRAKYMCIPNGVNISDYRKQYECPELIEGIKSACYIGSFLPDWDLIVKAAAAFPHVRFVVITPHTLSADTQRIVNSIDNVIYIDGIAPSDVPKWVTNCTMVLQPFPEKYGHNKKKSLGLTAQNYKAIAANKPIIAYGIPLALSRYGLLTCESPEQFVKAIQQVLDGKWDGYKDFDIKSREWRIICDEFMKACAI